MSEEVTPQVRHLLEPLVSFSPASKAGERSWACALSRLSATRPTSCLSSQTRESRSSTRAWSRSEPSSCNPRAIVCSFPVTVHKFSDPQLGLGQDQSQALAILEPSSAASQSPSTSSPPSPSPFFGSSDSSSSYCTSSQHDSPPHHCYWQSP